MGDTRRKFLKNGIYAGLGIISASNLISGAISENSVQNQNPEPVIDIHQHTFYSGRTDGQLLRHQKNMGVTKTVLLPVDNTSIKRRSTHYGYASTLHGTNETCYQFARDYPDTYYFGANAVPDIPEAIQEIEKYLKLGAKIIGEMKFAVACDSKGMQDIYRLAGDYGVPVLMHWEYENYNFGFPRFHKMLEKYPGTNFIGHAQTWWANIDKKQEDHPWEMYPRGPIARGGITDRYLTDYPNMYGGLSAGSAHNAFIRDPDFIVDFFERHQDKLFFGSDCSDSAGNGEACIGSKTIGLIKKLMSKNVSRKLLYENAKKHLKI